jgi:ribokinase
MAKIYIAGSLNMDLVARVARHPQLGETVPGRDLATFPGGKGANQAVATARLGGDAVMVGRVGDDAFGVRLREFLRSNGVDLVHVTTADLPTGVALIVVADSGENSIVVVPGANERLTAAELERVDIAAGDLALCQFETPLDATESFFARSRAAGARTILNAAPARRCPRSLLELADLVIVNETELAFLLEQDSLGVSSPAAAAAAASRLRTRPDQIVIATLGPQGCVALVNDRLIAIEGHRVEVVDTTGAGDTFIGALAARLAAGHDLEAALVYANAAAALSVQRPGAGPSIPTPAEVDRLLGRS